MNLSLPPEVSAKKQRLEGYWTYTFRHNTLGELGQIILTRNSMSCPLTTVDSHSIGAFAAVSRKRPI